MQNLMTANDVAEMVGLSRWSVLRAVRAGALVGVHLGRNWRFRLEDVIRWVEGAVNG